MALNALVDSFLPQLPTMALCNYSGPMDGNAVVNFAMKAVAK